MSYEVRCLSAFGAVIRIKEILKHLVHDVEEILHAINRSEEVGRDI